MHNQPIIHCGFNKINFRQERKGNTDISIINPVPRAVVYGHEQRAASVAACLATCPCGWPFLSASQHARDRWAGRSHMAEPRRCCCGTEQAGARFMWVSYSCVVGVLDDDHNDERPSIVPSPAL